MCTGIGEPAAIVNHCNLVRVNLNYAFYYVEVDKTGQKKMDAKCSQAISSSVHFMCTYQELMWFES